MNSYFSEFGFFLKMDFSEFGFFGIRTRTFLCKNDHPLHFKTPEHPTTENPTMCNGCSGVSFYVNVHEKNLSKNFFMCI